MGNDIGLENKAWAIGENSEGEFKSPGAEAEFIFDIVLKVGNEFRKTWSIERHGGDIVLPENITAISRGRNFIEGVPVLVGVIDVAGIEVGEFIFLEGLLKILGTRLKI